MSDKLCSGKFIKRPPEYEMITFEDFVAYGKEHAEGAIINGMPWSFKYKGTPVTHETDTLYLISEPQEFDTLKFTPNDVLVSDENGVLSVYRKSTFVKKFGPTMFTINYVPAYPNIIRDIDDVLADFQKAVTGEFNNADKKINQPLPAPEPMLIDRVKLSTLLHDRLGDVIRPIIDNSEAVNRLIGLFMDYLTQSVIPQPSAEEMWDNISEYMGTDLDDMQMYAGKNVVMRKNFIETIEQILGAPGGSNQNNTKDEIS